MDSKKNKMNYINLSKLIKITGIIAVLVMILCIVAFFKWRQSSVTNQKIASKLTKTMENTTVFQNGDEIGEYVYNSNLEVVKRITGIGPFDSETETNSSNKDKTISWTAGNDTSEDDKIVRSFDQISWTVENTMSLKENSPYEKYMGGIIEVKVTLPEECADLVMWDKDSMSWAENAVVSEDGRTFTAQYTMTNTEITAPGKQRLVFILKILGASNGQEISPTFSFKLSGNDDEDIIELTDETVYVSAAPNYNIELKRNSNLEKKVTVDVDGDGQDETTGRMYGYGVILQLYNTDSSKGLKGIEYPKGDISFDIDLTLERTLEGSNTTEDITDICTPILWNYKVNRNIESGNIAGRTMYFNGSYNIYIPNAPYGIKLTNRTTSVYNSGNISMVQNGSTISTTISGYEFDGTFPMHNFYYSSASHTIVEYTENIGCFSVGYFQVLVPYNEESTLEDRSYYLTVADTNFKATSNSGVETTTQMVTTDDKSRYQHTIYREGTYNQAFLLYNDNANSLLTSKDTSGDGYAYRGQYIQLWSKLRMDTNNEDDVYTVNKFIKFDGDCVEPELFSDGSKYKTVYYSGTMKFNVWYVTKKDGTNWKSTDEMNNANIEDMLIFETIDEIPEGYICVGEYFESDDTYGNLAVKTGENNCVSIRLKVKETATVGQTYGFTGKTEYWIEALDRSIYTIKNLGNFTYPTATWDSGNSQYIKTEYNEKGTIISGTHYLGNLWGQSLLVVEGDLSVTKKAIDESGNEKINYDFSKNEYDVTYKLQPAINNSNNITSSTLMITDTLPKGMTYVAGSSDYGEPEITHNTDETTTLIWHMYGVSTNNNIEPITYQAHIDETIANGTNLESTVIIEEVPEIDSDGNKTYMIGNTEISNRTYKTSVQVINLSSYSLYKTTETPIIEINGTIHYKITLINKTDDSIPEFQLLDILPYNGDNRGTSYSGTYTVEKIDITQTNTSTGNTINNDNLSLYVTSDESVREGVTAKDENLGITSIWSQSTSGENLNKTLTAYALIGEVESKEKIEIDIYLKTEGNNPYDKYKNSATAQTDFNTDVIETSIITVEVVKRMINGYAWFDSNKDGLINEEEKYLSGVKVTLLKEDGTEAVDINGNKIASIETDENGYYNFEDMQKGNYIVQVEVTDDETEITKKNIGTNVESNSKFNLDGKTDVIQSLNNIESPILTESYVNVGIAYKDTSVLVHHYIEGTTTKISDDVIIDGKIYDTYSTSEATDIPSNYELVSIPVNSNGIMSKEQIEVIYYYKLKTSTIENEITKTATANETVNKVAILTEEDGPVKYQILYKTTIENYKGKAMITIVDTLPSEIDKTKSDLNGGIYNETDKTIKWEEEVDINTFENGAYEFSKTIEISIVYKNQNLNEDLVNEVSGKTTIYYPQNHPTKPGQEMENKEVKDTATVKQEYTKEISINKIWEDNDNREGKRPESVTIQLTAYGKNVENTDVILNQDNNWTYTYKDLPKYTEEGIEIEYSVVERETNSKDLEYYEEPIIEGKDNITITNKYKLMETELESKITKQATTSITSTKSVVVYKIEYQAVVEKYIGEAIVTIVDTLPYRIDEEKSDLNGGIYNAETQTITWKQKIDHINTDENGDYNVDIDKEIKVVFIDIDTLQESMNNHVKGTIDLYETEKTNSQEADAETKLDIKGSVVTKYIDKDTGKQIENSITITDKVGKEYKTENKTIENYEFIEVKGKEEGKIAEEEIEVIYYYTKLPTQVIVKYVDEDGKEIAKTDTIEGKIGENYNTEAKELEEYELVKVPENSKGEMTKETIIVTYVYKKAPANVIVKYLEKGTQKELAEEVEFKGYAGDRYNTERKVIINYRKATPEPENAEGKMLKGTTTVIYYYEKIPSGAVSVKYVDIETKQEIADGYIIKGYVGDSYKTEEKQIAYYELIEEFWPENSNGMLTEKDNTVIYYYKKIPFNMSINKTIKEIIYNSKNVSIKDGKIVKLDVVEKETQNVSIKVKYSIVITNTEELTGIAQVIDKIPKHFKVAEENPDYWKINQDGNLETTTRELEAGECVELEVVLDWINGDENFGEEKNIAIIANTKNVANYEEINKADNTSEATIMLGVQTGIDTTRYLIGKILLICGLILIFWLNIKLKINRIK